MELSPKANPTTNRNALPGPGMYNEYRERWKTVVGNDLRTRGDIPGWQAIIIDPASNKYCIAKQEPDINAYLLNPNAAIAASNHPKNTTT